MRFCRAMIIVLTTGTALSTALAAPPSKPRPPAAPPAPAPAPAPVTTETAPAPKPPESYASVADLLNASDDACRELLFERCIELASAALGRPQLTDEERVRAYVTVAGAYAVVGQPLEAEKPYRLLLRLRPDFDLPSDTPPRILGVFRKVQAEENAIRDAVKEAARKSLIQSIALDVEAPAAHQGGTPLTITARLTDPRHGVQSLTLQYRTDPSSPFASMPFQGSDTARTAVFSAAQTSSDAPVKLEYSVVARDADGVEVAVLPVRTIEIAPGHVQGPPLWEQRQFRIIAGVTGAALTAGAVVAVTTLMVAGVGGSGAAYLLIRGNGVSSATTVGTHYAGAR